MNFKTTVEREKAEKYVREQIPELNGKHNFNFTGRCIACATPRYIIDRRVSNRIVNEGTGGSSQEVEETQFNTTDEPCLKSKTNIQLQHWLQMLSLEIQDVAMGKHHATFQTYGSGSVITFDLTTGQPATEADYRAFNTIVGI